MECPNKTERCPAPGAKLSSRCFGLCSAKASSIHMYPDNHYEPCSLKFTVSHCFFFSYRFRAKKKIMEFLSGMRIPCSGSIVPNMQRDLCSVPDRHQCGAPWCRGHDNDRIAQGPGNMSAVQNNELMNSCLHWIFSQDNTLYNNIGLNQYKYDIPTYICILKVEFIKYVSHSTAAQNVLVCLQLIFHM